MKNRQYTALPYEVRQRAMKLICQRAVQHALEFRRDTGASSKETIRQAVKNHKDALAKMKQTVIADGEGTVVHHYIVENERDVLKFILMTLDIALETLEGREE